MGFRLVLQCLRGRARNRFRHRNLDRINRSANFGFSIPQALPKSLSFEAVGVKKLILH